MASEVWRENLRRLAGTFDRRAEDRRVRAVTLRLPRPPGEWRPACRDPRDWSDGFGQFPEAGPIWVPGLCREERPTLRPLDSWHGFYSDEPQRGGGSITSSFDPLTDVMQEAVDTLAVAPKPLWLDLWPEWSRDNGGTGCGPGLWMDVLHALARQSVDAGSILRPFEWRVCYPGPDLPHDDTGDGRHWPEGAMKLPPFPPRPDAGPDAAADWRVELPDDADLYDPPAGLWEAQPSRWYGFVPDAGRASAAACLLLARWEPPAVARSVVAEVPANTRITMIPNEPRDPDAPVGTYKWDARADGWADRVAELAADLRAVVADAPAGVFIGHRREERPHADMPPGPPLTGGRRWLTRSIGDDDDWLDGVHPEEALLAHLGEGGNPGLWSRFYAAGDRIAADVLWERAAPLLTAAGDVLFDPHANVPAEPMESDLHKTPTAQRPAHRIALATHRLLRTARRRAAVPPGFSPVAAADLHGPLTPCGDREGWACAPCWSDLPEDALTAAADGLDEVTRRVADGAGPLPGANTMFRQWAPRAGMTGGGSFALAGPFRWELFNTVLGDGLRFACPAVDEARRRVTEALAADAAGAVGVSPGIMEPTRGGGFTSRPSDAETARGWLAGILPATDRGGPHPEGPAAFEADTGRPMPTDMGELRTLLAKAGLTAAFPPGGPWVPREAVREVRAFLSLDGLAVRGIEVPSVPADPPREPDRECVVLPPGVAAKAMCMTTRNLAKKRQRGELPDVTDNGRDGKARRLTVPRRLLKKPGAAAGY